MVVISSHLNQMPVSHEISQTIRWVRRHIFLVQNQIVNQIISYFSAALVRLCQCLLLFYQPVDATFYPPSVWKFIH